MRLQLLLVITSYFNTKAMISVTAIGCITNGKSFFGDSTIAAPLRQPLPANKIRKFSFIREIRHNIFPLIVLWIVLKCKQNTSNVGRYKHTLLFELMSLDFGLFSHILTILLDSR